MLKQKGPPRRAEGRSNLLVTIHQVLVTDLYFGDRYFGPACSACTLLCFTL